ncbi:sulfotransferase [Granulosicoccus sp.]|nr:sulfotransferase [Granulosicoccus sp.]MDB4223181.1 sulfotransferase [Granulosicoccus sp.]
MVGSINLLMEKLLLISIGSTFICNRVLAPQISQSGRVGVAIDYLSETKRLEKSEDLDEDSPIFVLSAGWGAGSTLVQRLIISSGEALIWGEPLDHAAPIQRLAETVAPLREDWPPEAHYVSDYSPLELSKSWIANMIPDISRFRCAHKEFLTLWLNHDHGSSYHRWGLKEVRLTIDHAKYLKWLYPKAKFVFLYRDLYSSYLSCRNDPWTSVWPNYKATPIVAFAHHWRYLLGGFVERHQEVDGILVKYEDLCNGDYPLAALQEYLGLSSIDTGLLEKKVGGRSANRHPLIYPEKLILDGIAGDLRKKLGYK